ALVLFSPENPRVRALQTQVAALEEAVDEQLGGGLGEGLTSAFDVQIADIDGQIDFLAEQKALLEKELAEIEASIAATPANAIVLGQLRSDYDNLRVQYDQATQSLADARMGDRIEVTARGQRITLVERAAIPSSPSEPNRKLIVAAAFGAGVVLAAALLFVLEVLNSTVRRPAELVTALDIKPFGTVPFLVNRTDTLRERKTLGLGIVAILLGLPVVLYLVYIVVIPQGDIAGLTSGKDDTNTMAETARPENLE
nr:lipopolysaccharide biosynthesis [Tabrizicola sp.]